jgi:hypothetical protein
METQTAAIFTTADARAAGWTRSTLEHAVRTERIVRLHRGIYVPSELWRGTDFTAERRRATLTAAAAVRIVGPAQASHVSSALLADLPVWRVPRRPCLTVPPRFSGDTTCAHLHRAQTPVEHLVPDAVVARLSTSRTILDIAREHGLEDAIVVGDAALRLGKADEARLVQCAEFCEGWPGMRRARHLLELLDERSESPLESVSRLRLSFTRIPAPDLQPDIVTLDGRFLGRPDFYWDEFGVAGEVDGREKYRIAPDEVVMREKRRQGPMEDAGVVFTRWTRADLENMPLLARRLETTFARGARRSRADRAFVAIPLPRVYTLGR